MADKGRFRLELDQYGGVVDPGCFNKTIILLGLAGCKMISYPPRWLSITSYPARPRRMTVN